VERLVRVNGVAITWAIAVPSQLFNDVLAYASSITGAVEALVAGGVTLVGRSSPRVLVGLHDIKLGAPVACDHVGITVAVFIRVHPDVATCVFARHLDEIPGSYAAALVVAEVDVPLNRAAKEVWLEVFGIIRDEIGDLSDVATSIFGAREVSLGATTFSEVGSNVESLHLAVNLDINRRVFVVGDHLLLADKLLVLLGGVGLDCGK